jgi:predicted RNA polymerase sigma factor
MESPRLIAGLARMVRDVPFAEDLAQDALVAALETWPGSGVPDNPGAWLMATAKHRAIDLLRRSKALESTQARIALTLRMLGGLTTPEIARAFLVPEATVAQRNRAVALTMAFGPAIGLQLVDALVADGALDGYHLLPSVRGDILAKLGRPAEAAAEFRRAAELTDNARERELLLRRAAGSA